MMNIQNLGSQESIRVKYIGGMYSQTCLNDHLYKATNAEFAQANSHTIVTA